MNERSASTDARPQAPRKRRRLSKRALRTWAWLAAGLAFFSPWTILGLSPKPAVSATEKPPRAPRPRRVIIVRKITRRVIVKDKAKPQPVHYVYSGGSPSGSSGGSYSAPAPNSAPAPPATSSGGSHP